MIIVTRPSPEGNALTQLLIQAKLDAIHCPLFEIEAGQDLPRLQHELNQLSDKDYVIIVSPQVSHTLQASSHDISFPKSVNYFAVGEKSAALFRQLSNCHVTYPPQENSEGLIQLLNTYLLKKSTALILRGNNGRTLLGDTLIKEHVNVKYLECYRRKAMFYPPKTFAKTDTQPQIIVVSSVEHLLRLDELILDHDKLMTTLIVTSPRILEQVHKQDWHRIILTDSANNQNLFKTIVTLCHNAKVNNKRN